MSTYLSRHRAVWSWGVGLLLAWWVVGAVCLERACGEELELTSLLGSDVGLCIEIRDLKSHLHDVPKTEWFRRLQELPFVKRWQQSSEFAKWQAGQATLAALVGQPLEEFVSELFGESVVLAVSPSQTGPPVGILLSRAAKDETWDRVLALWDQLEAHDVQTRSAFGHSFQVRRKKTNGQTSGPDLFTVKLGRTFAISEREELIRAVLARASTTSSEAANDSLEQAPAYRRAIAALPEHCSVRLFVDPRRWDEEFRKKNSSTDWPMKLWRKMETISAGLELSNGVMGHVVIRHNTDELPISWEKFVEASETTSDLTSQLPANSILTTELRGTPDLLNWLRTLDDSEKAKRDWQVFDNVTRGVLSRDLFGDVLPKIRPSLGGAIIPKKPVQETSAPVDALLALQMDFSDAPLKGEDRPDLREALDGALTTLLNFAGVSHNSRNPAALAMLRVRHRKGATVKWLDSLPPYQPAFGIGSDRVLLATNPDLISRFFDQSGSKVATLETLPLFSKSRSQQFAKHSQWIFINVRAAREFLTEEHEPLSRQIAHWRKVAVPSVAAQLDRFRETLTPFDVAFVAAKVTSGELRFTVGAVTSPESP